MTIRQVSLIALLLAAAFSPQARADPAATMAGGVLVNASGMTLYTFDKDVAGSGRSQCNGPCIALWPAESAAADAQAQGDLTVITRDDGSRQWAYRGKPLYTYAADKKPGDRTGDNVKDVWHVVK